MNNFRYCQTQIEGGEWCEEQCEHCKEYYAPLEKSKKEEALEWMYESETYKEILSKAEPHIGTLVLDMFEVVLLVGVEADEDDYYYVYQPAKGSGWARKDGKQYWSSCVGRYNPLKGVLPEREYNYLVWLWNNNYNIGTAK